MGEHPEEDCELQSLLERHRAGDPAAPKLLIKWADQWARPRIRSLMRRRFPELARWEDVEDLHHGVLIRLSTALITLRPATPGRFTGLLSRHMYFHLSDRFSHHYGPEGHGRHHRSPPKKKGSGHAAPEDWLPDLSSDNPARRAEAAERAKRLHECINRLPPIQREVASLRGLQGLEHEEVAAILKLSVSTVKRKWVRARLRLTACMEDHDPATS